MAYDDDKLGTLFPTRFGKATGTTNERKMLDAIKDTGGFRTRLRENADGTVTRLRTRGGFPIFTTEPKETKKEVVLDIYMDSGAVDLVATASQHPQRFDDGILHYGDAQRGQVALLGKINPTTLVSTPAPPPELSAPKAYSVAVGSSGVRDADRLNLLYLKKVSTAFVPASMFCGKARLYAQAQYGAPLKYWSWAPNIGSSETPALYFRGDQSRALTTSSGVYLDSSRTHWLLTMDNLGVRITKLVRDDAVKPLVKKLGGADNDKIEAYILSRSYPSETMSFWLAVPGLPGCNSMGYGWKFNWDGTTCDIISHRAVPQIVTVDYFEATHYRIEFARSDSVSPDPLLSSVDQEKQRWSARLSVVEGPTVWHNSYTGECIAHPLWGEYVLQKFGTKGGSPVGNAPVYCFYKRNELEVIRYYSNGGGRWFPGTNIPKYRRTTTPTSFFGQHDWSVSNMGAGDTFGTIGADGGHAERHTTMDQPLAAGFTSSAVSATPTTHSYSFDRYTAGPKTFGAPIGETTGVVGDVYLNVSSPVYTQAATGVGADGVALYTGGNSTPAGDTFLGNGYLGVSTSLAVAFDTSNTSGTHTEQADVLLIIPFHDAEAVYVRAVKSVTEHETGFSGTLATNSPNWAYRWRIMQTSDGGMTFYEVASGIVYRGSGGTQGYNTNEQAVDETTSDSEVITSRLITSAGDFPFNPSDSMNPFSDGAADVVERQYFTQSSTLGACFGKDAENPMGFGPFDEPVPFIGWA